MKSKPLLTSPFFNSNPFPMILFKKQKKINYRFLCSAFLKLWKMEDYFLRIVKLIPENRIAQFIWNLMKTSEKIYHIQKILVYVKLLLYWFIILPFTKLTSLIIIFLHIGKNSSWSVTSISIDDGIISSTRWSMKNQPLFQRWNKKSEIYTVSVSLFPFTIWRIRFFHSWIDYK